MLVYIDRNRTTNSEPKKEYIHRMNEGIRDALAMGVPKKYVQDIMRKFIPVEGGDAEKAMGQMREFKDESGVFSRDQLS